jgi:glycosyltransferase involved in cell wall biosynthesis
MKRMRIALDACTLGRRRTGDETYTRGLLNAWYEMRPDDLDLHVITTSAYDGPKNEAFCWHVVPRPNFFVRNFYSVPRMLPRIGIDLYHANYWTRYWDALPKVVMIHDVAFAAFEKGAKKHEMVLFTALARRTARKAEHILTVSEFSKGEIHKYLNVPLEKITVTYNGLDACFTPAQKPVSGAPYILYVGTLHPRKNLVRLIEAFLRLKREHNTPLVLKIVGKNVWLAGEIFDSVRKSGLESSVEFTGYISQEQLAQTYQNATLMVLPSLYEGFGLPVIEAMGCGVPVVTSNSTALAEVAGDAAELVDARSAESIYEGICRVISSEGRQRELRERGLLRARQFNWRATAQKTLEVYRSVLAW